MGKVDGPLVGVTDDRAEGKFVGVPLGGVVKPAEGPLVGVAELKAVG